jgi:hypothetical protein
MNYEETITTRIRRLGQNDSEALVQLSLIT